MSDSDDTDELLLIPPEFFTVYSSSNSIDFKEFAQNCNCFLSKTFYQQKNMSGNYHHLPPRHQVELINIDARLTQLEKDFPTSCEISSFTNKETIPQYPLNYKQQSQQNHNEDYQNEVFCHSTPIQNCISLMEKDKILSNNDEEKNIITEIDGFLEKSGKNNLKQRVQILSNPSLSTNQFNSMTSSVFSTQYNAKESENLISLNELWNASDNSSNNCNNGYSGSSSLQEERLRRQHCEKVIKALQDKLLEYQQKLSVAIQVDKVKDNVLGKIREENHRLRVLTNELDEKLLNFERQKNEFSEKLRTENEEFKTQKESLENELSQALNLVSKFQDKNKILEIKVENLTRASTEVSSIYKKQIEDFEVQLSNYQKNEKTLNEELISTKSQLENLKLNNEKLNKENLEMDKLLGNQRTELEQLKHSKTNLIKKLDEYKKEIDELEKKNKEIKEYNLELDKKEKCLLKELENQRFALKSHYQQQLENLVEQKLKEFQSQLDNVEECIKQESKDRERLIAERAIKQLEMINEKNEQEIMLLNEKHYKEVELYRIQLANSVKKISELEEIIEDYKNRRADIAKKLHTVMETQWKKALEILTSPSDVTAVNNINNNIANNIVSRIDPQNTQDQDKLDGVQKFNKTLKAKPENEYFETPKSSTQHYSKNITSVVHNQKNIDRLQAYIEMLLNKSPSDLDNLQEILAMPKTTTNRHLNKNEKTKNENVTKPPWK